MPNIDKKGNKIAAKKESKKIMSSRIRAIRKANSKNPAICDTCGFHIRSKNHINGTHHKSGGAV